MKISAIQGFKVGVSLAPVSANGAYTCTYVDTKGFSSALVIINYGVVGTGDFTVLKLQESDTTSNFGDITGATFTGSFPGDTSDGLVDAFIVTDLRKRKRYIQLAATSGAASIAGCTVILFGGDESPDSATERGLRAQVVV